MTIRVHVHARAAFLLLAALAGCAALRDEGRRPPPEGRPPLKPPPETAYCPGDPSYGIGQPLPPRTPEQLSDAEVKAFMAPREKEVMACYEERLRRGYDVGGRVGLRWEVSPEGYVQRLCLVEDETGDGVLVECLLAELGTWQWPRRPDRTEVRRRFTFRHPGE